MLDEYLLSSGAESVVLLKNFQQEDHLMFLYTPDIDYIDTLGLFLMAGVENNERVLFISTGYTNDDINNKVESLLPEKSYELFFGFNDPELIRKYIHELKDVKNYKGLRMVIDYGYTPESCDAKDIVAVEREISKMKKKTLKSSISAFNTTCLSDAILKDLIPFHEKIIVSGENRFTALMYNPDNNGKTTSLKTVPRAALEKVVKNHLETLIMSMLMNKELCGHDIIKNIQKRFQTKLSPGTVYPILYSMKKAGIIKNNGTRGKKTYIPTKMGERTIRRKIQEFLSAKEYITEFITGNGRRVPD